MHRSRSQNKFLNSDDNDDDEIASAMMPHSESLFCDAFKFLVWEIGLYYFSDIVWRL